MCFGGRSWRYSAVSDEPPHPFELASLTTTLCRFRSPQHRFDEFGINIPDEYVGWEVGERLAKLRLGGVKEEVEEEKEEENQERTT